MISRYSTVIFTSSQISDHKLSSLKSSCADALCLKIGSDITAEAADFLCDKAPVTRLSLITDPDTGAVRVSARSAARIQPGEATFATLDPDQVLLFSHT